MKIKKTGLVLTSDYLKRSVMSRIHPGDVVILPIECRKGLEDKATVVQYYRNIVLLETLKHKFKISLTYFDANQLILCQSIQQKLEDDELLTDFDPVRS